MSNEKTFAAIEKLKEVEAELHRLKNALEMANRALDAQRTPLTEERIVDIWAYVSIDYDDEINIIEMARAIEAAHGIKQGEA